MGIFYVFFLGGEPFLKENFIDIIEYASKLGLGIMITTNGTIINSKIAKKLRNIDVSVIRISIDSANKDIHNLIRGSNKSFDKCINALKCLSSVGIEHLGISTTLGPDNYKGIEDLVKLAKNYKCNHIQITPISPAGRARETGKYLSIKQVEEVKKVLAVLIEKERTEKTKFVIDAPEGIIIKPNQITVYKNKEKVDLMGCGAGRVCLSIYSDGRVGYCLMNRKVIDSLNNNTLLKIWKKINKEIKRKDRGFCKNCKNIDICAGPCMVLENTCDCEREKIMNNKLLKEVAK